MSFSHLESLNKEKGTGDFIYLFARAPHAGETSNQFLGKRFYQAPLGLKAGWGQRPVFLPKAREKSKRTRLWPVLQTDLHESRVLGTRKLGVGWKGRRGGDAEAILRFSLRAHYFC